jgi:hypothetical protein
MPSTVRKGAHQVAPDGAQGEEQGVQKHGSVLPPLAFVAIDQAIDEAHGAAA